MRHKHQQKVLHVQSHCIGTFLLPEHWFGSIGMDSAGAGAPQTDPAQNNSRMLLCMQLPPQGILTYHCLPPPSAAPAAHPLPPGHVRGHLRSQPG